MLNDGATFIDVAYSTNLALILSLKRRSSCNSINFKASRCILSIDTFRSAVAKVALENGAAMINDISGKSR
jgi:dihydropteroate synthase